MSIDENEIFHSWSYFCSLCKDHGSKCNSNVNSIEFQQLITLTAMEFENISKRVCKLIDDDFDCENANIIIISSTILLKYPKIGQTLIVSDYQQMLPLEAWKVICNEQNNKKMVGLEWWRCYNIIKHGSYDDFNLATLSNAIKAISSLMVMELYYMRIALGFVTTALNKPCVYFSSSYPGAVLCDGEKNLPDFE